jgi:hypothetical protein
MPKTCGPNMVSAARDASRFHVTNDTNVTSNTVVTIEAQVAHGANTKLQFTYCRSPSPGETPESRQTGSVISVWTEPSKRTEENIAHSPNRMGLVRKHCCGAPLAMTRCT